LHRADEGVVPLICPKAVSNDFFEKLTRAFEEGDRAVGFGVGVVRFMGFRDDDDVGGTPRVCAVFQGAIERRDDEAGISFKCPFKELVGNPGRPWGRFV
jgi:hypothetical protein